MARDRGQQLVRERDVELAALADGLNVAEQRVVQLLPLRRGDAQLHVQLGRVDLLQHLHERRELDGNGRARAEVQDVHAERVLAVLHRIASPSRLYADRQHQKLLAERAVQLAGPFFLRRLPQQRFVPVLHGLPDAVLLPYVQAEAGGYGRSTARPACCGSESADTDTTRPARGTPGSPGC